MVLFLTNLNYLRIIENIFKSSLGNISPSTLSESQPIFDGSFYRHEPRSLISSHLRFYEIKSSPNSSNAFNLAGFYERNPQISS